MIEDYPTYRLTVLRCGEPHVDGLIYSEEILQREIDKKQRLISERKLLGPIGDEDYIKLNRVSFLITAMKIVGGILTVDIQPLATPAGKPLAGYLAHAESSRTELGPAAEKVRLVIVGRGTTKGDRIQEDYELLGFKFPFELQDHLDSEERLQRAHS